MNFLFALKILILVTIAFLVVVTWIEVLTRSTFIVFDLKEKRLSSWVYAAVLFTLFFFALVILFRVTVHHVLGQVEIAKKERIEIDVE